MLALADMLVLPPGVRVHGMGVADDVRGTVIPANDTAIFVLTRAGRPLGAVAAELARRHGIAAETADSDVLRFAHALNRADLANVLPGDAWLRRRADWIRLALRLAPAGAVPASVARRFALDTSTSLRGALGAIRVLLRRSLALAAAAGALASPGGLTPGAVALGVGVGLGLLAHEAGHAASLAGIGAALVVSGLRIQVLHRTLPGGRRRIVAAAGPLAAAVCGAAIVGAAWLVGTPEVALAGCAPAAHAIGLTVAAGDGRAACGL